MPPGLKTLAALAAAATMVGAAVVGRGALERNDLRFTVVCDLEAEAFCQAAKAADDRLTIKVESPDVTTKRLTGLSAGERPDFQAWVSVGPWLQMADGRRVGQAPLQQGAVPLASSPLVLVTRSGQTLGCPGKPPAGCLPLGRDRLGLPSPRRSGVGLAGLAQIVLARTAIAASELDRSATESGQAAAAIDAIARATDANPPGLGQQLNINFSQVNPVVTTRSATAPAVGRAVVITSEPPVRAVLQVGLLDVSAQDPMSTEKPAGRALAEAATDAGWDPGGDLAGGLPDPGVLAALQDAWPGP